METKSKSTRWTIRRMYVVSPYFILISLLIKFLHSEFHKFQNEQQHFLRKKTFRFSIFQFITFSFSGWKICSNIFAKIKLGKYEMVILKTIKFNMKNYFTGKRSKTNTQGDTNTGERGNDTVHNPKCIRIQ